jgi:hypothetical protein
MVVAHRPAYAVTSGVKRPSASTGQGISAPFWMMPARRNARRHASFLGRHPGDGARRAAACDAEAQGAATEQGSPLAGTGAAGARAVGEADAHVVLAERGRAVHDARAAVGGDVAVGDHAERAARPRQRRKVGEQRPVRAPGQLAAPHLAQHLRADTSNTARAGAQGSRWVFLGELSLVRQRVGMRHLPARPPRSSLRCCPPRRRRRRDGARACERAGPRLPAGRGRLRRAALLGLPGLGHRARHLGKARGGHHEHARARRVARAHVLEPRVHAQRQVARQRPARPRACASSPHSRPSCAPACSLPGRARARSGHALAARPLQPARPPVSGGGARQGVVVQAIISARSGSSTSWNATCARRPHRVGASRSVGRPGPPACWRGTWRATVQLCSYAAMQLCSYAAGGGRAP